MEKKKILRPNPNWEEDLENATRMNSADMKRVLSYPIRKKKRSSGCFCTEAKSSGLAPDILLSSGKTMPGFGLGTWLGAGNAAPGEDDSVENAVKWAIEAGYRHIDTASVYKTERQVGRAVNKKIEEGAVTREELFITTKLWNDVHARSAVIPALRQSLKELNLSYVDLYLIHWPVGQFGNGTFDDTDYLDTWKGMVEARDLGLTKSIGVSNFNLQQMERLNALSSEKPAVLQVELNLNLQQPELLAYCCKNNISVVAYTPFGSLFHNKAAPHAPPPRTDNQQLLKISDRHNKTIPQIALRYLVELGAVPIPKSVTKERVQQNIQVFDFELSADEREVLKSFDRGYRTIVPTFLQGSPYYPFETKTAA